MKTFTITGAKWFDKVNGNTYHNSKIVDSETMETYYTGFQYGYGSQYIHTAKEYIENVLNIKDFKYIDNGSFNTLKRVLKINLF